MALMELSDADELVQYPIWAPDMPGAGESPVPTAAQSGRENEDGSLPDGLDRIADAYVALLNDAGYTQAIWAGLSMGGYVVLGIQRRHPQAVAGIALLDTKGDADGDQAHASRIAIAKECVERQTTEPVMFFVDVHEGDSSVKKSAAYIDQFSQWIREQQPDGVAWRERMAAARPDLNDEFAKITAPAAVICGEDDPSSAPAVMRPLAERMVNTTVVMTEIEDCGHFSAWERPETVARALHELVSRVPAAAGADPAAADAAIAARRPDVRTTRIDAGIALPALGPRRHRLPGGTASDPQLIEQVLQMPSTCVLLCRKGKVAVPFGQHNMAQLAASRMRLATLPGSYVARALEHGNNGVVAMYLGRYKGAHDEHAIALT